MSLRRARKHPSTDRTRPAASVVPPVLPQVLLEAVNDHTLIVTVNGDRLAATPISRGEIAKTVTELVARFGVPTRVEVRELDGSVHADILTPPAPQPRSPFAPPEPVTPSVPVPSLLEFMAERFVPGEDVAVAVVVRHSSADPTGMARALLDRRELPQGGGEVVLLGRISGTTSVHPFT